jgi:disulfide bond formation protein DsbB
MNKNNNEDTHSWTMMFICWMIASIATLGSLFFSEYMQFPPCVLCWYQRIAMYPLVVIFAAATFFKTKDMFFYSFPLTVTGLFIAIYHNLLNYEIIPESASPCVQGVSCTTEYISWFGFLTIPFLSFIAFSIINILLIVLYKRKSL